MYYYQLYSQLWLTFPFHHHHYHVVVSAVHFDWQGRSLYHLTHYWTTHSDETSNNLNKNKNCIQAWITTSYWSEHEHHKQYNLGYEYQAVISLLIWRFISLFNLIRLFNVLSFNRQDNLVLLRCEKGNSLRKLLTLFRNVEVAVTIHIK